MASVSNGFCFYPSPHHYEELYNCCCMGVNMDKVVVNLSNTFDRKPLREDLENKIEQTWQEKLLQCPLLYNGTKFRLKDLALKDGNLILNVGITCYRDFICTNMCEELRETIRSWGTKMYDDPHACFADPIGANGLVISRDDEAVFIRRSQKVYEFAGRFHTPGGHPEPNELKNEKGEVLDLVDMDPKKVAYELYHCIAKEVRDEVNLPIESLSWPVLLGIIRNPKSSGRPEMCYFIRCSLSSKEIKAHYDNGGPEAYESTEIAFIKMSDVKAPSGEEEKFLDSLTPPAKAALHFYIHQNNCQHKCTKK